MARKPTITVTEVEVSGRGDSVRAAAKARPTGLVIDLIVLIIWGFGGCRGSCQLKTQY